MEPLVLLDTGPSGRLVAEPRARQLSVRAEGELWQPVAELLSLSLRNEAAASAIEEMSDLSRGDLVIEAAKEAPQTESLREAWSERYPDGLSLCAVRLSVLDLAVVLPREALRDFRARLLAYREQIARELADAPSAEGDAAGGEDDAVSRGTSPKERLFGPEFWFAGVGSALLLSGIFLFARC